MTLIVVLTTPSFTGLISTEEWNDMHNDTSYKKKMCMIFSSLNV